jgi:hypothetical protein
VADQYFGVGAGGGLQISVTDARQFLQNDRGRFDVIEADIFAGGVYAPFHVVTREFFQLARDRLHPTGVMAVNVLALGNDDRIARAVAATMRAVFPSVYELPLRDQRLLYAFPEAVTIDALRLRLDAAAPADLQDVIRTVRTRLRSAEYGAGDPVMTDDHAPIDRLTDQMLQRQR